MHYSIFFLILKPILILSSKIFFYLKRKMILLDRNETIFSFCKISVNIKTRLSPNRDFSFLLKELQTKKENVESRNLFLDFEFSRCSCKALKNIRPRPEEAALKNNNSYKRGVGQPSENEKSRGFERIKSKITSTQPNQDRRALTRPTRIVMI